MASDNVRARSCPTCHSITINNEKNCADPWHNAELEGEADFNYKGGETLWQEVTPEMAEKVAALRDATVTLSGTFDSVDVIGCPTCLARGFSFGCADPLHEKSIKSNVDSDGYGEDGVHISAHTRPDPDAQVQRWADVAMWQAPHDPLADAGLAVTPTVTLIHMTSIPLQVMAAAAAMYRGEIVRDPRQISVQNALHWLRQTQLSRASQSQLEFVDLHFLIEGVTRAFTHQLVRQRVGATYVQESMRFAVKDNAKFEVAIPAYFDGVPDDHPLRRIWDRCVAQNSWAYNAMVDGGVPAEDARGVLPTNITTRIHYKTTLRGLVEHAGLRLCSQAQHEWKQVWDGFITAILAYGPPSDSWQQNAIASLFRPVCYNTGKCEFMGEADRFCPIRERVQHHHERGEGPDQWHDIHPLEALRYGAARVSPDVAGNV